MSLPNAQVDTAVLITGASAGIGTELATQLAKRGHGLILVARRKERLEEIAAKLTETYGVRVEVVAADLTDRAARDQLINQVNDGDRKLVGLCNNAGFGSFGKFHQLPLDSEMNQVELNIAALQHLTGAFLPGMVARGSGAVLNVASTVAAQPLPGFATYGATKAFVVAFSDALHEELRGSGVSCSSICPGPVDTEFAEVAGTDGFIDRYPKMATLTAEEVASQAVLAMIEGKRTVTPGLGNKISAFGGRFSPRSILLPVMAKVLPSDAS